MFGSWKEKRAEKKAKDKAIRESQYWKNNALLQSCLQAMRGSCTLAPVEMHEAAIAVVNIALRDGSWTNAEQVPAAFFDDTVYLVWTDEKFPVLKAPWAVAIENLPQITAVTPECFLVSESLDRIIWFDGLVQIKLYSIAS